jgi:hypothetical protein
MKLSIKILTFFLLLSTLIYCRPDSHIREDKATISMSEDTIFNSIKGIESYYKKQGYFLLLVKSHAIKQNHNLLVIFDNKKIDSPGENRCKRVLKVFKIEKNKYFLSSSNTNIIGCANNFCSPSDSFIDVEINNEEISIINQYCVSDGRKVDQITFRYDGQQYLFSRYKNTLYDRNNPDNQFDEVITAKDIIPLRDFRLENLF